MTEDTTVRTLTVHEAAELLIAMPGPDPWVAFLAYARGCRLEHPSARLIARSVNRIPGWRATVTDHRLTMTRTDPDTTPDRADGPGAGDTVAD